MEPTVSRRWQRPPVVEAEDAVRIISSGDRVYLHEVAMTPHALVDALFASANLRGALPDNL